jgi:GTP pyrophosphokinase
LVTAGPTHEAIDPVRYIANRSSGRQGFAIAAAAAALGADVTLIAGPVHLATPPGVARIDVETAIDMQAAVEKALPVDAAIMVAAVADWRAAQAPEQKIKKDGGNIPALNLTENPEILASLAKYPDDLASAMGLSSAQELFEQVGKDELSLRAIENHLRPSEPQALEEPLPWLKKPRKSGASGAGGVLVVGVDSLMTQLAKCCKPAPPDDICGFVTRGKGVSIHRSDCTDFAHLQRKSPDRVIEVQWGGASGGARDGVSAVYPVDVAVEAQDRQGLLRDISDVFAREKMNVIGVQTQSVKGVAWMTFTIEVNDARQVARAMSVVGDVPGVRVVRRK